MIELIVLIAAPIIAFGGFGIYVLCNTIYEKFFEDKHRKKAETKIDKKGKERSRGKNEVIIIHWKYLDFCYTNGRKVINRPIYKKPDGTYCEFDAPENRYMGYCGMSGTLSTRYDRYGNLCNNIDKHGNKYVYQPSQRYYEEEPSNTTNQNNGYYEEEKREINHRVDWRADGSYGDIYDNGYQQTDEWGNPLY